MFLEKEKKTKLMTAVKIKCLKKVKKIKDSWIR